ncbi:MAG: serine hydrolase [Bacilli bacterium]|nr:serine hydrolase [Bacilli bacterium]
MFNDNLLNKYLENILIQLQQQTNANKDDIKDNLTYLNSVFKKSKDKTPEEIISVLFEDVLNSVKAFADQNTVVPGISVSSSINGVQMTAIGGFKDGSKQELLKSNNMFDIASISKMYTAIMLYQLLEEGLIHPTDKIKDLLPELTKIEDDFTLLEATNYLATYNTPRIDEGASKEKAEEAFREIVIAKDSRGKYNYNDMASMIFSRIIEKVTNKSYVDNLNERIIKPLGLNETELAGHIDISKRALLTGSQNVDKGLSNDPKANILGGIDGHAGIFTSTNDSMKVLANLVKGFFFKQNLKDYYTVNNGKNNRAIIGNAIIPKEYYNLPNTPVMSTGGQGSTRTSLTAGRFNLNGKPYILSNAVYSNGVSADLNVLKQIEVAMIQDNPTVNKGSIVKYYNNTDTTRIDIRKIVSLESFDDIMKEISKFELRTSVLQAYLDAYDPNYELKMDEVSNIK